MIGKILFMLKKVVGKKEYILPIYDDNIYSTNMRSVTGNSLCGSNVLALTNEQELIEQIKFMLSVEQCYSDVKVCSEIPNKKFLKESISKLVGPCTHIINVITDEHRFDIDISELVYRWLQVETDYLVEQDVQCSLTTAVIYGDKIEDRMRVEGICSLIQGLGTVLPTHRIIENGVVASNGVPTEDVMKTALYLNGKYGQILCGECLRMDL